MRHSLTCLAALGLLGLTACGGGGGGTLPHVSAEGAECREKGFQPGTADYTQCMMDLDAASGKEAPILKAKATETRS